MYITSTLFSVLSVAGELHKDLLLWFSYMYEESTQHDNYNGRQNVESSDLKYSPIFEFL